MKRKGNLYKNILDLDNIESAYKEVCRNTRNPRRVMNMKQYKAIYIARIYNILANKNYEVGPYNKFVVYEPKERQIVSQGITDKVINHLVARYILYPALLPCLIEQNVASRVNKGTKAGIEYQQKYIQKSKIQNKNDYYVLKCDISKFFNSIDHDILKKKIERRIKDKDALDIIFKIIDSNDKGLYIGAMTNQVLAIFFLNDMDKYIKETLKIKYYVRYQDDFLLFHHDKKYLQYCLTKISEFLEKEHLKLNAKTRIYKATNNYTFLGRNSKGRYVRYRNVKRKLKARRYLYQNHKIPLMSFCGSKICYEDLLKRKISLQQEETLWNNSLWSNYENKSFRF